MSYQYHFFWFAYILFSIIFALDDLKHPKKLNYAENYDYCQLNDRYGA